jgi:hypothetical protein
VNTASPEDSFIFVKSVITEDRSVKKPSWSKKEFESSYEPTYDEDKEWVSKDMKDQILSTVSSIQEKELKDREKIYIVLGVASQFIPNEDPSKVRHTIFYANTLTVIRNLSAELLCYLNKEHTNLLVSCRLGDLTRLLNKRKFRNKYFDKVKRISPLLPQEQISKSLQEDSEWKSQSKEIVFELIPNIPIEKKTEYAKKLSQHLTDLKIPAITYCDENFIATKLDETSTRELLNSCNFVFRVTETPKGILEQFSLSGKRRKTKTATVQGKTSSVQPQKPKSVLPVVCVLDSGVNSISQLDGLLVRPLDGHRLIPQLDDDYRNRGHGTPIAYLATFGENGTTPKARIISYKIYTDNDSSVYYEGYGLALAKYSSDDHPHYSRIFVSSINFKKYNDPITAYIDRCIQQNNVCMVFSAGNIDQNTVINYAERHVPCSSYISRHPIQDPAQAVNGVAIGAIAKRDSANSISRANELSPFSTCGTVNGCLYDCEKPEFVEHGGNQCLDGTPLGLTSFDKNGNCFTNFLGTSFSAPLFANHLAEIVGNYGTRIKNAETLKAIALALSHQRFTQCKGYGEPKSLKKFDYHLKALVCSEGDIPLLDTISEKHWQIGHRGKITVVIPNLVNSIKLFLVHSDNHYRDATSHLNTYLTVKATKIPHDTAYGKVDLRNPDENKRKSNMKVFEWAFPTHSMGGIWTFFITPELTADLSAKDKKATTVRYGCAILASSKTETRTKSLTGEMYDLNSHMV